MHPENLGAASDDRNALTYLEALWPGGLPADGFITVAVPGTPGWFASQHCNRDEAALDLVRAPDRYLTMAVMSRVATGRGGIKDTLAIPGLWVDLDTLEGSHKHTNLPSPEEGLEFLLALPRQPSVVLASGGGYYGIWLFQSPWVFDSGADRQRAQRLSRDWQDILIQRAAKHGWHVDNTSSLAQPLRAPGTLNGKYTPPRIVHLVSPSDLASLRRYAISEFDCPAADVGSTPTQNKSRREQRSSPTGAQEWMTIAAAALGGALKPLENEHGGGIVLRICPFCGGKERAGRVVEGTAHIARKSGFLRCKRASCEAVEAHGGLPIEIWGERLEAGMRSALRVARAQDKLVQPTLTDDGNAIRLLRRHGPDVAFVSGYGWRVWDGERFAPVPTTKAGISDRLMDLARESARCVCCESENVPEEEKKSFFRHVAFSLSEPGLRRAVTLLRTDSTMPSESFDADPFLLNVQNGTLDLRDGKLLPHDRKHRLSMLAGADFHPRARCSDLDSFLRHLVGGDEEFLAYLQRVLGYVLFGANPEDLVLLALGPGGTGKTTLIEAFRRALGDYAGTIPFAALIAEDRPAGPRPEIVALKRKRFVSASEAPEGALLNAATLKALSGGDTINARGLYESPTEFRMCAKTCMAVNHAPRLDPKDTGARRRLVVLPFEKEVAKCDPGLRTRLQTLDASTALLAFAYHGYVEWTRLGQLGTCSAVELAKLRYWETGSAEGVLRFVDSCCSRDSNAWTSSTTLLKAAVVFTQARNLRAPSGHALAHALRARGFLAEHKRTGNGWNAALRAPAQVKE